MNPYFLRNISSRQQKKENEGRVRQYCMNRKIHGVFLRIKSFRIELEQIFVYVESFDFAVSTLKNLKLAINMSDIRQACGLRAKGARNLKETIRGLKTGLSFIFYPDRFPRYAKQPRSQTGPK